MCSYFCGTAVLMSEFWTENSTKSATRFKGRTIYIIEMTCNVTQVKRTLQAMITGTGEMICSEHPGGPLYFQQGDALDERHTTNRATLCTTYSSKSFTEITNW